MDAHKRTLRLPKQREMIAKNIIIATLKSVMPLNHQIFVNTDELNGLSDEAIWPKIRNKYFAYPDAEYGYPPMHFFQEFITSSGVGDYISYVGLGITDRSWFIEKACKMGVLDMSHINDILIVVAENPEIVPLDQRFMERLADTVLCPSLKREKLRFFDIVWYEEICNKMVMKPELGWNYGYCDLKLFNRYYFEMAIRKYERRFATS